MWAKKHLYGIITYCLTLLFIYPFSPAIFNRLLSVKEKDFICPLRVKETLSIRSDTRGDGLFSARRSNGRRHNGLDLAADIGEPVFAAKSGFVETGVAPQGMGKYVTIFHLNGYSTIYGHLNSVNVIAGSWVWQGQRIAEVGKTGNANYRDIKPHLHFEIRKDGVAYDPMTYISKKERKVERRKA